MILILTICNVNVFLEMVVPYCVLFVDALPDLSKDGCILSHFNYNHSPD